MIWPPTSGTQTLSRWMRPEENNISICPLINVMAGQGLMVMCSPKRFPRIPVALPGVPMAIKMRWWCQSMVLRDDESLKGQAATDGAVQQASSMDQCGRIGQKRISPSTMMIVQPDEAVNKPSPTALPLVKEEENRTNY